MISLRQYFNILTTILSYTHLDGPFLSRGIQYWYVINVHILGLQKVPLLVVNGETAEVNPMENMWIPTGIANSILHVTKGCFWDIMNVIQVIYIFGWVMHNQPAY